MAVTDEAEAGGAGLEGEATGVAEGCPKTILEIGVFFDGTYNNYENTQVEQTSTTAGSFAAAPSNVYYLHQLYHSGPSYDDPGGGGPGVCRKFHAEYINGVGTRNLDEDGNVQGDSTINAALGFGQTGVEARVGEACISIARKIRELSPLGPPEEIIFDVFGFSRGAATARVFINAIRAGWLDQIGPLERVPLYSSLLAYENFRIRYLGIFDTVASIGLGMVEYNWGLNLHLDEAKQADKMFHVTAYNEHRINFRLNESVPGGGKQHPMPGVHADIGGGYRNQGDIAPLRGTLHLQQPQRGMAQAQRDAYANAPAPPLDPRWVTEGWVRPEEASTAVQNVVSQIVPVRGYNHMGAPITTYEFTAAQYLYRPWVKLGLSKVSMAAVHYHAQQADVPMSDMPAGGDYQIPTDLLPLVSMVRDNTDVPLPYRLQIVHDYAHISSNPNSTGMSGQSDRVRRKYANRPGAAN